MVRKFFILSVIFVIICIHFFYFAYDYVRSGKAAIPVKIQIISKSKTAASVNFFRISPKGARNEIEKLQEDLWFAKNIYCKNIFFTTTEIKKIEEIVITIGHKEHRYNNKAIQDWKNKNNQYEIPNDLSKNTFIGYGKILNYAGNLAVVNYVLLHALFGFSIIIIFSFFLVYFEYFNLYSKPKNFYFTNIFLGALAVIICTPLLYLPPGRDMGWFAFHGMNLTNNILPYINYNEFNMPGQTLLYALVIYLFGNSVFALRLVELILLILSGFALSLLLKRHIKLHYWMLVVVYYFLNYMSYGYYFTGERDGFVLFFIIFSLWAIFNAEEDITWKKQFAWIFAAGLFAGTIILFRSTYMVFLPFLILFAIFKFKNVKQVLLFALSLVVPVGFLVTIFYCIGGWSSLQKFYENIVVLPIQSYSYLFGGEMFSFLVVFQHLSAVKWWLVLTILFIVGSLWLFNKRSVGDESCYICSNRVINFNFCKSKENEIIIFCLMFLVSFCCIVFIHGSFQWYHAIPFRFIAFLLCMVCMKKFLLAFNFFQKNTMFLPLKGGMIFFVFLMITVLINIGIYNEHPHGYSHLYMVKQNYLFVMNKNYAPDEPSYDPVIHRKLGLYLNKMTEQNDKIQLWVADSLAYVYANRPFSSVQTNPVLLWLSSSYTKEKLYQDYLNDIRRNPPRFFVIEKQKKNKFKATYAGFRGVTDNNVNTNIRNYPELYNFIINNYNLKFSIGNTGYDYMVYIRNAVDKTI